MGQALGDLLQNRTVRFVITGGSAAVLLYGLTFTLLSAGASPFWGTLAAYTITVVASYTVQHAWTFGGQHRHGDAFPRYVSAQIFCAATTALTAKAAVHHGLVPAATSLSTTLLGSAMSYCLSRFWVFRDRAD